MPERGHVICAASERVFVLEDWKSTYLAEHV